MVCSKNRINVTGLVSVPCVRSCFRIPNIPHIPYVTVIINFILRDFLNEFRRMARHICQDVTSREWSRWPELSRWGSKDNKYTTWIFYPMCDRRPSERPITIDEVTSDH